MDVNHRHIIYVQGYDPRGLAQYYRMFRTELRKFGRLHGLSTTIGRPRVNEDDHIASWNIETSGADGIVRTDYDFLRVEDLIKKDLAWPIWRTLVYSIAIYWRLVFSGTLARFWRAHWRFAIFISFPHIMLVLQALLAGAISAAASYGLGLLGAPPAFGVAAGFLLFLCTMGLSLKLTENYTYTLYLLSDTIFTWQLSHRQRKDWDDRIDHFAQHLVKVARASTADEIVLVGHSSGSFLGVEILARALELDPDLGKRAARLTFLTLGGNLPIVGFHQTSAPFREHLRQLATHPDIDWIDCQSRKDVMNFYPFDPIAGHDIEVETDRRNPLIVPVRFRELVAPEYYNRFRWQFFRVHFQFVMANDLPNTYDFYMIVCGRLQLRDRFTADAMSGDLARQARKRKRAQ